jgi:glycerophosphoryl diester phosphodiesterase
MSNLLSGRELMPSELQEYLQRLKPGRPLIVGHRGDNVHAPENTPAAIQLAWELGVDSIEVDIHLTADGRLVVIHDPTTGRTADEDLVVAESSLDELQSLDAGSWFSEDFAGERIPTFEEVIKSVPEGKFLCVELKEGEGLAEAFCEEIQRMGFGSRVCALAFNPAYLKTIKALWPDLPVMLLLAPDIDRMTKKYRPFTETVLERVRACGADAPACFEGAVTEEFVQAVQGAGMPILTWVTNRPARAKELAKWGVDAIASDDPGKILASGF